MKLVGSDCSDSRERKLPNYSNTRNQMFRKASRNLFYNRNRKLNSVSSVNSHSLILKSLTIQGSTEVLPSLWNILMNNRVYRVYRASMHNLIIKAWVGNI